MPQFNISQKLKNHQITAKKSLGQNFIFDENVLRKIVSFAGDLSKGQILEIGPGPGGLTQAILEAGAQKVVTVEKDPQFSPILSELKILFPNKLTVLLKDALKVDLRTITDSPLKIIANLPYQISTILLLNWLTEEICNTNCKSLTLMFQKEVADRIIAHPGSKTRSKISFITELFTNAKIVLNIPAGCFIPRPKVNSSLVHFEVLKKPKYQCNLVELDQILRFAFNQKRKMLKSSLKTLYPDVTKALNSAEIIGTERPETIDLYKFCNLSLLKK
ncbi:MAG: 16S rRNA (adenine(1518)-N(6)/adenine(1519)-N(6))-dimethyltransferase RsmA [Paracoccaceae bacterium]